MQAHTNADDATRYRPDDEVAAWPDRDPLLRSEAYLSEPDLLTEEQRAEIAAQAEEVAAAMRDGLMTDVEPDPQDLFAPRLRRRRRRSCRSRPRSSPTS